MTDDEVRDERRILMAYLKAKAAAEDWHAVADAAMDLREIDAYLRARREKSSYTPDVDRDHA